MSCNCNSNIPCGWDFAPSIYISAEDPLKANGMSVKLKYADNLYLNDKGELCAKAGSGTTDTYTKSEIDAFINGLDSKIEIISGETEAAVEDIKVNGVSVVTDKVANVDLSPYALSANVQSQVTALDEKIEVISAETQPYSAGSGINIANQVISVAGGNVVNSLDLKNASPSGTVLTFKQDGRPNDFVAASFGKINGQNMVETSTFKNFELLSGITIPRGTGTVDVPISDYKAVLPKGDSNVFGVVTVDNTLFSGSTNPVQNNVIKAALDGKANGAYTLVSLSQAEYDALATKDPATIYFIQE